MDDNDTRALRLAAAAVTAMDVKYRNGDTQVQIDLEDARNKLWTAYALARNHLLATGVMVTDQELSDMETLGQDLHQAAQTMAFAGAAVSLAKILAKIALA